MNNAQPTNCVMTWWVYPVKKTYANVAPHHTGRTLNAVLNAFFKSYFFNSHNVFQKIILIFLVQTFGFNQRCNASSECDTTKSLVCKDGICQCKDSSLYWNQKVESCSKF